MIQNMIQLFPNVSEVSKVKKENILKSFLEIEFTGGI